MQNAAITLNNMAAVAKTFTPVVVSGDTVIFEDLTASTVSQRNRVVTRPGRFTKTRPTNRPFMGFELPIVRTINGVPTVVGTNRINIEGIFSVDATATENQDIWAFAWNGLNQALLKAQFRDADYTT